jgi:hypothetical protein
MGVTDHHRQIKQRRKVDDGPGTQCLQVVRPQAGNNDVEGQFEAGKPRFSAMNPESKGAPDLRAGPSRPRYPNQHPSPAVSNQIKPDVMRPQPPGNTKKMPTFLRSGQIIQIYEVKSQIQRIIIARELFGAKK